MAGGEGTDNRDTLEHELDAEGTEEDGPAEDSERAAVRELVKAARARGEDLTGPDGLLKFSTKEVLESALEEEMNRPGESGDSVS